jgi:hypothetical protein
MMTEKQRLLEEYAASSKAFADAVERLRVCSDDVENFIHLLDEAGTAHRASEQSRIRLNKYLAQPGRTLSDRAVASLRG